MPAFKTVYDKYEHTYKVYVEIEGYFRNYWRGVDKCGYLRPWWAPHPRFTDSPTTPEDSNRIINCHLIRRRNAREKKLPDRYESKIEYISEYGTK